MSYTPKVTLTMHGIEELKELIQTAYEQVRELEMTVERINSVSLDIQAKINQPMEMGAVQFKGKNKAYQIGELKISGPISESEGIYKEEKELLRQQMKILAEQSKRALDSDLSELSNSMNEIYRSLSRFEDSKENKIEAADEKVKMGNTGHQGVSGMPGLPASMKSDESYSHKVKIDGSEIFLDGQKIKGVTSYKLEARRDQETFQTEGRLELVISVNLTDVQLES